MAGSAATAQHVIEVQKAVWRLLEAADSTETRAGKHGFI